MVVKNFSEGKGNFGRRERTRGHHHFVLVGETRCEHLRSQDQHDYHRLGRLVPYQRLRSSQVTVTVGKQASDVHCSLGYKGLSIEI